MEPIDIRSLTQLPEGQRYEDVLVNLGKENTERAQFFRDDEGVIYALCLWPHADNQECALLSVDPDVGWEALPWRDAEGRVLTHGLVYETPPQGPDDY
jgi:hypothetical protein